ncbi:MAG: M20/M25/M40 family metallo-hydrolase [Ignavibacteriaceae bacterium]
MKKAISFLIAAVIILSSSFLLINTAPAEAPAKTDYESISGKIVASALQEQKGYEWLRELCEIGPRLSGSKNFEKAIEWAKEKMEKSGYDVWLQPVMVPHWERGTIETAEITSSSLFQGRELNIASLGRSIGTPPEGITAGVLEVESFEELEQKKNEAKGKIIFYSRALDPALVNTFDGYGGAVDQRSNGAIEAARYGGVAVLVRSITTRYDNVPHVGAMRNYVSDVPQIPGAALGYSDADFLSDALKKDPNLKITVKMDCKTLPDAQSYNVIADMKGTKYPDEVIVVAGHFDSWDKGDGAHDDGGGCMQALEVLDLFKRLNIKPQRTIRCILYTNEENGVMGGREYGVYAEKPEVKHVAAIESDRGVFSPRGFEVEASAEIIKKMRSWLPVLRKAGIEWVEKGGAAVDISFIKTSKALISYVPDGQKYFDFHHSDNDVFEEVHPREMELGTAAIAVLAYLISEEGL